jgi:ribonuclease HI
MSAERLCVRLYVDGGARGNPGPAGAGVVIVDRGDGATLYEGGLFLGRATNNVAEYRALVAGLKTAGELGAAEVEVLSDSELLVRQMTGEYRVRNAGLQPLHRRAQELAGRFGRCRFRHVRREANSRADGLVNRAINLKQNVESAGGRDVP